MKKIFLKIYSLLQSLSGFRHFGANSVIKNPSKIWNRDRIEIGSDCFIAENSFLGISKTPGRKPLFKIGNNCCIGANFFVACISEIILEDDVLLSDRVFISDHIHNYCDVNLPIIKQELLPRGSVLIKQGAFIGINVVIMPGVTIGKNSIVGASSVVIDNVPDYSVATGNPAKIIKKYDFEKKQWIKIS